MRFFDVVFTALNEIRVNMLRSFFTLLGIIVSVAFLVAVTAIIQGMNSYVKERVAGAVIGTNSFQIRRAPNNFGRLTDNEYRQVQRRPRVTGRDFDAVQQALPDARAISYTSGWPTPQADIVWRDRVIADVLIFGVTAPFQEVQDYRIGLGRPLTNVDIDERRAVVVIGPAIADSLFNGVDPIGRTVRLLGEQFEIIGVNLSKGRVLGQSFDGYVLMPLTRFEMLYGRRNTATISVKVADASQVPTAMAVAEEAVRVERGLRPGEDNNFSVETADALVEFWTTLTRVLFAVIPAIVAIGIVVGGIVIMNIMLMSVTERTREIGIRKAVGASSSDIHRQFLAEAVSLASVGGAAGVLSGWLFALLISAASPLPAQVTPWSVAVALALGGAVGIASGVLPARRAARLDPIAALRAE